MPAGYEVRVLDVDGVLHRFSVRAALELVVRVVPL